MASGLNETKISKNNNSNFRTQRVMMMLADVCVCVCVGVGRWGVGSGEGTGGLVITNDVLKLRKVIEFESSCIVICFFCILSNHRWRKKVVKKLGN